MKFNHRAALRDTSQVIVGVTVVTGISTGIALSVDHWYGRYVVAAAVIALVSGLYYFFGKQT